MQPKPAASRQISFLMPTLGEQLDLRQPLKQLADTLPWSEFEPAFGKYYSEEGQPAKPVRLMVGLLLLKQMFNLISAVSLKSNCGAVGKIALNSLNNRHMVI